jgi:hypothetical protein
MNVTVRDWPPIISSYRAHERVVMSADTDVAPTAAAIKIQTQVLRMFETKPATKLVIAAAAVVAVAIFNAPASYASGNASWCAVMQIGESDGT